jgi:hypothetical protein
MQILKGKKDSHSEINQYVSEKETQVISIDKWASNAKANRQAYESTVFGKTKEDIENEYNNSVLDVVNEFMSSYPPNFGASIFPEAVDEEGYWKKDILFITCKNFDKWSSFLHKVRRSVLDYSKWDEVSDPNEVIDKAIGYFKSLANNQKSEIK